MQLSRLIDTKHAVEISGISADSRRVRAGYVFVALPGSREDGAKYIGDAVMHGASVIIAERGVQLPPGSNDALLIEVDNPRLALAEMAAKFYNAQPETIVAVTGTSGKTSTASFTQQIWELSGIEKAVSLGTLGVRGAGLVRSGALTTPDAVSLHAELSDLAAAGITHLAMEASSHGLDQYRLHGVNVSAAAYTNLSHDHLDYHQTMDEYFLAKALLFTDVMKKGAAVLCADDARYEELAVMCKKVGHKIISYGENGCEIKLLSRAPDPLGQSIKISVYGSEYELLLPLVGQFQVMNALAALGLVLAGAGKKEAPRFVPLLEKLQGVPGRLQRVPDAGTGIAVYVDYAHKPAALEAVLGALRPHTRGRLVCVFGCGGDRDSAKRPAMGRIASGLSDLVVVTDDNPRSEDPAMIRAAIMEAAPDAKEIGDRREAIRWAIEQLADDDVLVIAGKGHESGQIIGDRVEPFDDLEEAAKIIKTLNTNEKA
ncbi:MAG: UDP-N-acetylmuramoyl-L-alanyl-D-glutamate--2,6-diaminopimelate ligase [Micavibrio sp.]